jgi:aryl-alcohol dehydrogenase-like predicted oxidoreductase
MLTRPVPKTGEELPVVGLGTWQTFDVGSSERERAPLRKVLDTWLARGGRVIDSSPMYGRAEAVAGDLLAGAPAAAFVATKVWTTGRQAGIEQMEQSFRRLRVERMDLLQVHNLVDVKVHLPTLRAWKEAGKVRYLGVTHYSVSAFGELERWIRSGEVDFVQLPYNLADRAAEARLLPAARDTGTAVLVMRPFGEGRLLRALARKALPGYARELDCTSWSEFLLKFVISHDAVTCPIPATSNPEHLDANVRAGFGRLPDAATRERMTSVLDV